MTMCYRALLLFALAAGVLFCSGCGPANEENLGGSRSEVVAPKADTPHYGSYGEMMLKKTKDSASNKGAKGTSTEKKK
jgi:hypothetical protein